MLNGLMLDTVYGGRIDNDVDRRLLNVYLQQFFNHEVLTGNKPIYKQLPIKDRRALLDNLPANDSP